MSPKRRSGEKIFKSLLPIALLLVVALAGVTGWIINRAVHPACQPYLVTPASFTEFSNRGLITKDETWTNRDGTKARGWLLRGAPGAPAVILLHRYGADRSFLLNLGVKLNETTNFTILWPDLRGHGCDPPVKGSSFGTHESADALAAIDYLRSLKTPQNQPLVGKNIGLYGVELGSYIALEAALQDESVSALALDSVPASANDVLTDAVRSRTGMSNALWQKLAQVGMSIYTFGNYKDNPSCNIAARINNRRVLLLSGNDAGKLRESTLALAQCFGQQSSVEAKTDLPLSGYKQPAATGQQGEAYDRPVIDFFDRSLRVER
jgi:pimeloyl-ACP methyl ester carboxylesterase